MKLYELINPSDTYTFYAKNIAIAGAVAQLISPNYGAKNVNDETDKTPLIFWTDFNKEHGIDKEFIEQNMADIAEAFASFAIGSPSERKELDEALKHMSEKERKNYLAERQERQRTSVNEIGEYAYQMYEKCRKFLEDEGVGLQ